MFDQELLQQKLTELNEAWHTCARSGEGNDIHEMQRIVAQLDAAQGWFKSRNIKLDYDGETGTHTLSGKQPTAHSPSYADRLSHLDRLRRMNNR